MPLFTARLKKPTVIRDGGGGAEGSKQSFPAKTGSWPAYLGTLHCHSGGATQQSGVFESDQLQLLT